MTTETMTARTSAEAAALVQELKRRHESAEDFIVPTSAIRFAQPGEDAEVEAYFDAPERGQEHRPLTNTGHSQTAAKLNIPWAYYQRMREQAPGLLTTSLNTWLRKGEGDKRWMFRILDGRIRANLSDGYRALDNHDLFYATFAKARVHGAEVQRFTLTDDRFEMRLIAPNWRQRSGIAGDEGGQHVIRRVASEFIPGVYVANSETGKGRLTIRPFILDTVCANGLIGEQGFDRVHLGERQDVGFISAETKAAKDKTVWMEIADVVAAVFNEERFKAIIDRLNETAGEHLAEPVAAVDAVVAKFEMSDDDKDAILNELISPSHDRDPGRTVFGLVSAITERAKVYETVDPERATSYQTLAMGLAQRPRELVAIR